MGWRAWRRRTWRQCCPSPTPRPIWSLLGKGLSVPCRIGNRWRNCWKNRDRSVQKAGKGRPAAAAEEFPKAKRMAVPDKSAHNPDDRRFPPIVQKRRLFQKTITQRNGCCLQNSTRFFLFLYRAVHRQALAIALHLNKSAPDTDPYIVWRSSPRTGLFPYPAGPFHPSSCADQNRTLLLC